MSRRWSFAFAVGAVGVTFFASTPASAQEPPTTDADDGGGAPNAPPPVESPSPSEKPTPPGAPAPVETEALPVDTRPPLGLFPDSKDSLIDPRMARSWGVAPARWFLATTIDVGFIYARPRASFGYGKPFTSWVGIDVNPVASSEGLGAYGGLRVEVPFVDVRVGPRLFRAFTHTYLDPQTSYERIALETDSGTVALTYTLESELDAAIPLGPGTILARGSVSYVTNVPSGKYVYEETLHVIVAPPIVWRGRGGYALRLGQYSQHSIGLVVDVLDVPKRDDSLTIRVGPLLRFVLSRRVEVRGSFVTTVKSPDRIGLAGGDFTELGVRYRWATE